MHVQIFSTLQLMDMKQWILNARQHAKLTQPQLGELLGLTKGNISAWEKGRHEASLDQLLKIAEVTGYREPLPGVDRAIGTNFTLNEPTRSYGAGKKWPFPKIDEGKMFGARGDDLIRLEAAILIAAAQVGLDIKKT